MFELVLALALILVLYTKTVGYYHLIDDSVPMSGYLYVIPDSGPPPNFHTSRPHISKRLWAISVHMLNTILVYLLIGGKAALLFAVFPINANNVAWITGSYYSTATFMTLTSMYFILKVGGALGLLAGMAFYATALNCTVSTIAFPFTFLFGNPLGLVTLFPLVIFLFGKRFQTGIKIRLGKINDEAAIEDKFTPIRLVMCTKVLAQYLYTAFFPIRLCFFHHFGNRFLIDEGERKILLAIDKHFFAALGLILAFIGLGVVTGQFFWAMWFLVILAAFSQFKILGQFFAERYMYPAVVGFVAVLSVLPSPWYWMLVGLYIARTYMFIPVFRTNEDLYKNGVVNAPAEACNHVNLSDWYLVVQRQLQLAAYHIDRAAVLDPRDFKTNLNRSTMWIFLQNFNEAMKEVDIAIEKATGRVGEQLMGVIKQQKKNIQETLDAQRNEAAKNV